jgi:hypothetical protein
MDREVQIHKKELTSDDVTIFERITGLSKATSGRHSTLFFGGLYVRAMLQRNLNPAPVIQEILALEGKTPPTGTKPSAQFKGRRLGGLWHKHYLDTNVASLAMNIQNGWKAQGMQFFKERIAAAEAGTGPRFFTKEDVPAMVNDLVSGTYGRRRDAHALTGEWIVYATHEGQNYYLALWNHADGDEMLRSEIERICIPEFPFLKDILVAI